MRSREKIRKAKESVTNDYVKAYIEAVERSEATALPPLEKLTIITNWSKMPSHKVEFIGLRADYGHLLYAESTR